MSTPTSNPVPSSDPNDLLFNAEKLDQVVNGTDPSFTDRMGVERLTLAGLNDLYPYAEMHAAVGATGATFYDTIALGRAAVVDGGTFGVKAGGSDGLTRPTIYRRDSSSTQTLLFAIVSGTELEAEFGGGTDVLVYPTFASLPASAPVGKYALVVADRLSVTSVSRARSNGVPFLVFNAAHGLSPGANVNIRGFGGVGYNGHFTLRTASSTFVDYRGLTSQVAESTTADTGGYMDRNGVYQFDGVIWSWIADIGATYPARPAAAAAARVSSLNKSAIAQAVFDAYFAPAFQPAQRVVTVNEAVTLTVDSLVPNGPESAPVISVDGVSLGFGTKSGMAYSVPYTAPASVDLDVDLLAVADTRRGTGKLAVAEAVRVSQDLTTWGKTNITSVTGGFPDPDGGNNAYRVLCAASGSAAQHSISATAVPASTGPLVGEEVWVKADTAPIATVGLDAAVAYINASTGETLGTNLSVAVIERRGPWMKLWVQQRVTGTPASTLRLGIAAALGTLANTTAGTEAFYFYKPRQVDGVLPFYNRQRAAWRNGSVGYATRYIARSDFMDSAATMNTDINVDVVVPDDYTPTKRYPVLYVREVDAVPGSAALDGLQTIKGLNVHNTYQCILVRNYHRSGDVPWDCVKNDGTLAHATFMEECLVDFIDRKYSTIRSREGRLLVGFSKSGFGAMSYLLRRPDLFGYAAAWDVPWGLQFDGTDNYKLDAFGNPSVNNVAQAGAFGTVDQYQLYNTADILASRVASVNDKCRIVLGGAVSWEGDLTYFRGLLESNGVPYQLHYTSSALANGLDHNWTPPNTALVWLPQMLAMLFALR